MKIEKQKAKFQPVVISITLENQKEVDDIYDMTMYNESIPDIVGGVSRENVTKFLNELRNQLNK